MQIKNPIVKFLVFIFSFYVLWFGLYELVIHPWQKLDLAIIDFTIFISKNILELMGYVVFTGEERVIAIDGTGGLWIGDNCNAISLFAIFTGFILAYPGKWKYKFFYIIIGILIIEFFNIIRIVLLAILDTYSRSWTEFNHSYTFNISAYTVIFLMWLLWVNKYSKKAI